MPATPLLKKSESFASGTRRAVPVVVENERAGSQESRRDPAARPSGGRSAQARRAGMSIASRRAHAVRRWWEAAHGRGYIMPSEQASDVRLRDTQVRMAFLREQSSAALDPRTDTARGSPLPHHQAAASWGTARRARLWPRKPCGDLKNRSALLAHWFHVERDRGRLASAGECSRPPTCKDWANSSGRGVSWSSFLPTAQPLQERLQREALKGGPSD